MMLNEPLPGKQRRYFSANEVAIAIDSTPVDEAVSDLQDSLLLQEYEPLLLVLAEALQVDYDWRPTLEYCPNAFTHSIHLVNSDDLTLGVCLPEQAYASLQQIGERLKSEVTVTAHQQHWYFKTTDVWLNETETAELENSGAILLVPIGLDGKVHGQLCCDNLDVAATLRAETFSVDIKADGSPQSRPSPELSESSEYGDKSEVASLFSGMPCQIRLPGSDPLDQREPDKHPLTLSTFEHAQIEVTRTDDGNTQYQADVIRIGDGLGLRIVEG